MNTITHHAVLPFINSVEQTAHEFITEELDELDSTALILDVIQIVMDNDEELTTLELVITREGYAIRYDAQTAVTDEYVLEQLVRGLEVLEEGLVKD